MPWSTTDRRAWLFPPVAGVVEGIDLANLDPADPDERHLLISFEHPDYRKAIQRGKRAIVVNGRPVNPTLHLALHEIVANQIWGGKPAVTWKTAERLTGLGYDRHDVLHMIMSVVGSEIHQTLRDPHLPQRHETIEQGLNDLPGSWEALRPNARHRPRNQRRRH